MTGHPSLSLTLGFAICEMVTEDIRKLSGVKLEPEECSGFGELRPGQQAKSDSNPSVTTNYDLGMSQGLRLLPCQAGQ